MLTWDDYRRWLGPDLTPPKTPAPALAALTTDSRTLAPGAWFVPLSGESFDGHRFIAAAMAQGAAGFFYAKARGGELASELRAKGVAVDDPLTALQQAASGWRDQMVQLQLIALTGSAGKTTTKDMTARILHHSGETLATEANFNNEIGVPKTLQLLQEQHRFAVLEFGARRPGNIKVLCALARPNVSCLLNVGTAHVGIFGSVEQLLQTKLEIFRDSPAAAVQIANLDDPRIAAGARETGKKTLYFGTQAGADVRVVNSAWLATGGMQVELEALGRKIELELGVAHAMFPVNAAAAAAMALAAGATATSIAAGLNGFSGAKGRYQIHRCGRLTVIDDTYNANPESLAAGLATVARSFKGSRVGLVLGDMLELGDDSALEHERIGAASIAPLAPSLLVTVGTDAEHYAKGASSRGYPSSQARSFANVAELLAAALDFEDRCDVLYIKGSNGIKLTKLLDDLVQKAAKSS